MASEPLVVQAIYSFKGTNNDELQFKKGDKITITQKEEGGWWEGTLADKTGWFPSNYVKEVKSTDSPTSPMTTSSVLQKQYRAVVLKDLIDSEKAHVSEQQGLVKNFLESLEKSTVLSSDEYRQLTGNLFEVLDTHQQLLHLIEEEDLKPSQDQRVGRLFLAWAPRVKAVHQVYCSLHPRAAFILDKYKDELTTYMESCGATSPGVLVLTIGLSKPFRRLEKYSGMLQELERHLEESHIDRGDTQRSVAVYKDIATNCLAIRRQKELELQVLTGPLRGWEGQSLITLGDIIYMGSVAVGPQHHDRYLVLFSSTLLILSVSPRFSAFIYEGKLPLTGITVSKLEDSELYKNAFEISGPLIEKRIAVCQSKEEANHWVDLLRKNMPHHPNSTVNQKVTPSQAEIVPQPPPHLDIRGYSNRTSVLQYNYKPVFSYKFVLPSISYPAAAPYANLTRYYKKLVKTKEITSRLLKKLLYTEYINKKFDLSIVKRRRHKTEITLMPKDCCRRISYIICDSDSDTSTDSDSDTSDSDGDDNTNAAKEKGSNKRSSKNCGSVDSDSSSNPFGYIRYYNPQTGQQREETKFESFIDYGEISSTPIVVETVAPIKTSVVLTSTASVHLTHQISENSEDSVFLTPKPSMACEDLVNLDTNIVFSAKNGKSNLPNTRQSLPSKFVGNKFNQNSLTTIDIPPWQSNGDHSPICRSKLFHHVSEPAIKESSSSSSTTHSSTLDLAVNPLPLPDAIVAELLYNSESIDDNTKSGESEKIVIKPPSMFRNTQELNKPFGVSKVEKTRRRSSIQINTEDIPHTFSPLRRCISYQLVQLSDPQSDSSYIPYCRCAEPCSSSLRSSDSGMAGSCTLNSPDFPLEKRISSELNIYNNEDVDLSTLGGNILPFSEMEARKFESQCQCTSPFGSTPRTSCQTSITENIITGSRESMRRSHLEISTIPSPPHPWESEYLIHSKLMKIRSQNMTLRRQRCSPKQSSSQKVEPLECNASNSKNVEKEKPKGDTYKSGLYAHWWLKAKIPHEVIKGIYEETRTPTSDVTSPSRAQTEQRRKPSGGGSKQ